MPLSEEARAFLDFRCSQAEKGEYPFSFKEGDIERTHQMPLRGYPFTEYVSAEERDKESLKILNSW